LIANAGSSNLFTRIVDARHQYQIEQETTQSEKSHSAEGTPKFIEDNGYVRESEDMALVSWMAVIMNTRLPGTNLHAWCR
jgi:hypothetical protein